MIQLKCYEHSFNNPAEREATPQIWIDLYDTDPIKLTLSIEDIVKVDATSAFSKSFKVPGTRNNAKFFNNSFEVNDVIFDVTIKKPAEILVDGVEFKHGHIRLQKVYFNPELNRYDYELLFFGETKDFASKLSDKTLCQLKLPEIVGGAIHNRLTVADIQNSWNAYPQLGILDSGLHNGNIIYPLIDHGNTYSEDGTVNEPEIRVSIGSEGKSFTRPGNPLSIDRFKPMIRAKYIWDKIFETTGYTYTSSFINSALFHQMYISSFGNTANIRWDSSYISSTNSGNICHAQNNATSGSLYNAILLPEAINDPNNNLEVLPSFTTDNGDTYNQYFTCYNVPVNGIYRITAQCYFAGYLVNSNGAPQYINQSLKLFRWRAGAAHIDSTPLAESNSGTGYGDTLQIDVNITEYQISQGDQLFLFLGELNYVGNPYTNFFTSNFSFDVISAPGEYDPVTTLNCTYKQIEFIKDILTAFRLVFSPDPNNSHNFIVEPWQTYINSGELYDWSTKLVNDKDIQIESIFINQVDKLDFSLQEGGDYANVYHKQAYSEPYGSLHFSSNNDLLIGNKTIKLNGIAPTILLNLEGSRNDDNFVIPQIHVHTQGDNSGITKHLPIKPKTRFLFYNGLHNSLNWYVEGSQTPYTSYPLVTPYQSWPIGTEETQNLNLNWGNGIKYFNVDNLTNPDTIISPTLYDNYWSRYISFLYGKYSRRITASFILNNIDINKLSFNDTILINGTYYIPEKIIDIEIGSYTQVKVQLLTANDYRPNIIPFQILLDFTAVGAAALCAFGSSFIDITTNGTPGFTWELSNGMTGSALTTSLPGQAPYLFTIENVPAGTYTLTINDQIGRTKTINDVIVPPSVATEVTATALITNPSNCNECDGSITVTPSGGTGPYSIDWHPEHIYTFTRTNLCAGQYSYTVYDHFECLHSYTQELTCEGGIGATWLFLEIIADCETINTMNEFYVWYPAGTTPSFSNYYKLTDLNNISRPECYVPRRIVNNTPDSLVDDTFTSCILCHESTSLKWLLRNCTLENEVVVYEVPGMTIGTVWKLDGHAGCYKAIRKTFLPVDSIAFDGPYSNCTLCTSTCKEYVIGGYDEGCTTYLNCAGIEEEACYNGIGSGGYDETRFCAIEIITFYGAEPSLIGLCPD